MRFFNFCPKDPLIETLNEHINLIKKVLAGKYNSINYQFICDELIVEHEPTEKDALHQQQITNTLSELLFLVSQLKEPKNASRSTLLAVHRVLNIAEKFNVVFPLKSLEKSTHAAIKENNENTLEALNEFITYHRYTESIETRPRR